MIEAVEGDGVLGVQWHPERLLGPRRPPPRAVPLAGAG